MGILGNPRRRGILSGRYQDVFEFRGSSLWWVQLGAKIHYTIYGNDILIGYLDARPKLESKFRKFAQMARKVEKDNVSEKGVFWIYLPCIQRKLKTVFWNL